MIVTSTLDDEDASIGDGSAVSFNGEVTLRSAIQESNFLQGMQIIYFYITQTSPVIQPLSALPDITDPIYLNGNDNQFKRFIIE